MDCIFTQKVSDIIQFSRQEANRLKNSYIGPEHFLLSILKDSDNDAYKMLLQIKVNIETLEKELNTLLQQTEEAYTQPDNIDFSLKATEVIKLASKEANELESSEVNTLHLLLGILKENENTASEILKDFGVFYMPIKENTKISNGFQFDDEEDEGISRKMDQSNPNLNPHSSTAQQVKTQKESSFLDYYSIDLTQAANDGKLDPMAGREKEIVRLAQILSRRKKNNPVLLGEPGVGKSAIVEGLAQRISENKTLPILFNKRILMLNLTTLVAGTKYRGQFEERINNIIHKVKNDPNLILFIDEIHTLIDRKSVV